MRRLNIRWRLTLWFGAAMTALLVVRSFWIYFMLEQRLTANTDYELLLDLRNLEEHLAAATGLEEMRQILDQHAASRRDLGFTVYTSQRELFFQRPFEIPARSTMSPAQTHHPDRKFLTGHSGSLGRYRSVTETVSNPAGRFTVEIDRSMQAEENEARDFVITLFTTGPMVIAAALAVGYLVSSRALTPVDKMISTAKHITARRLDQRIDVPEGRDELARLAQTLNEMIDRLHHSFEEMRQFTADAAHDLRTPVAALRTEVEVGLMANRTIEEYRDSLQVVLDEAIHLSRLTGQLLDLSREDHGLAQQSEDVRLDAIVPLVRDDLHAAAQRKGITVTIGQIPSGTVRGDPVRLRRVFMNLLDNAIQYTPPGGKVWIEGQVSNGRITMTVADNGPGIPAADLPFIFNRFRRVDKARNAQSGGTGLGLAICKAIVEAHGGEIVMSSAEGQGTHVSVTLPLSISPRLPTSAAAS